MFFSSVTIGLQGSEAGLVEVTEDCLAGGKEGTKDDTRMTRVKGDWAPWG